MIEGLTYLVMTIGAAVAGFFGLVLAGFAFGYGWTAGVRHHQQQAAKKARVEVDRELERHR